MQESLKTKLVFAFGLLSLILLGTTIASCNNLRLQQRKWRNEMEQRLDAEEKTQELSRSQGQSAERLRKSEAALNERERALDEARQELARERKVNRSLQEELEKMNRLNEALEEDLKEALSDSSAGRPAPMKNQRKL